MNEINKYVKTHEQRFLDELFELIRIPSISSLPEHKDDMYRAAEKWKELLLAAGVDRAEVMETGWQPGDLWREDHRQEGTHRPGVRPYGRDAG